MSEGNTYARQQESQATDTGQIFRGRKGLGLIKEKMTALKLCAEVEKP